MNIILHKALYVLIVIALSGLGSLVIKRILNIYKLRIAKRTKTKHDDELIPLIQRLLGIGVWVVGIMLILIEFGVDVTALYATAGVSSICTAMLLKDSITNVVAGVTLMFDRPFRVGDKVKLHTGDVGEIIKIGLRRTNVLIPRTKDIGKSVLVIPNKSLSSAKVYNYTLAQEVYDEQKEQEEGLR